MSPLTKNQKKAVEAVHSNVCVSAGAGTGKTNVLVERFLHLISHQLASSGEILAITFTEKAAQEMKSKIAARLKSEGLEQARRELENTYIGTIHSFCSRVLKEHPIEAGVDPEFRVLQEEEASLLKEAALEELIEARFQEPGIFNLLLIYSDPEIRSALKYFIERVHTHGIEIASASTGTLPRNDVLSRQGLNLAYYNGAVIFEALEPLKKLKDKQSDCLELERAVSKPVLNWEDLEAVKEIGKKFQRRGEAQKKLRDILDEWIAAEAERLGSNDLETFIRLAADFEARYSALKAERSSLDFNDLERRAFQLLSGDRPRSVACRNLYQKNFKFVMVDEFQDTSPIQDQIISLVASPGNLFIVGDWKQSIYGFRGADPKLLAQKEKLFLEGNGQQISLVENFRSRSEVLDQINSLFGSIWNEAGLFEPLTAGRGEPMCSPQGRHTGLPLPSIPLPRNDENRHVEFLILNRGENESVTEIRMKEARVLAERIAEMVRSGNYDYCDFAMLFRATTDLYFYEYELRNYGIPYYVVGGRGFYKQPEIRDIISFLELLENPRLDIPLAAVLRSPFVQISDDGLFWLADRSRRLAPPKPFYEALLQFENMTELNPEDKSKLGPFRSFLFQLLDEKEKRSISECIELIVERTKYDRYVLHLPQGRRHFANIRKLLEVAREVEAREPVHLGDFIRYVKGLETQEVRESEAQVEALEGNVVKLMTIHKAKGLEFKVVLLPDLNRKGENRNPCFLMDPDDGVGFKVWNEAARKFEETLTYRKIKEKTIRHACEESKRLLYVAMTRAKDHLILSGSSKGEEENNFGGFDDSANWFEWISQWVSSSETLKPQWVEVPKERLGRHFSPLAEHKKIKSALETAQPVNIKVREGLSQMIERLEPIEPLYFERIDLPVSAYAVFQHDQEEFRRTYEVGVLPEEQVIAGRGEPMCSPQGRHIGLPLLPYNDVGNLQPRNDKEIKNEEWPEAEDEEMETLSAADFGTLVHQLFEHLVSHPEKAPKKVKFWLDRFQKSLNESTYKEIQHLSELFLKSKQFSQIKSARKRYPEVPFVLRLRYGIIQGTLDLLYQNAEGEWVILDYKTTVIASPLQGQAQKVNGPVPIMLSRNDDSLKIHAERYQGQMLLYALACRELLKIEPKVASLYFVRGDQSFDFSLSGIDYRNLRDEFESLQKQILDKRKEWLEEESKREVPF